MPTHIIAAAGIVINEDKEILMVNQTLAIIEWYKAYLEYAGRSIYMEYVTRPDFQLKLKRLI